MRPDEGDVVRYPQHQWIDLASIFNYGNVSAGITMAVDALSWSNHLIQTDSVVGRYITFMFLLGPQFARHEIIYHYIKGASYGIGTAYMAKLAETADPTQGYNNPLQLIANSYNSTPLPTWVTIGGAIDYYNAATSRNNMAALNVRAEGAEGAPFTAFALDSDGFHGINGGPGVYALQIRMDTKNGLSSAYKAAWSQIGVHRIDESGFV